MMSTHRFEEAIGGGRYTVEVTPVQGNRWRASLLRSADVPSAVVPFYGDTLAKHSTVTPSRSTRSPGPLAVANARRHCRFGRVSRGLIGTAMGP